MLQSQWNPLDLGKPLTLASATTPLEIQTKEVKTPVNIKIADKTLVDSSQEAVTSQEVETKAAINPTEIHQTENKVCNSISIISKWLSVIAMLLASVIVSGVNEYMWMIKMGTL